MADTKLTDLPAFSPAFDDVLYGVDDPGGVPVQGKLTLRAIHDLFKSQEQPPMVMGSRPEAETETIPATYTTITLTGYDRPGDNGGGIYTRVDIEPTHAGKVQSADGGWWELLVATARPEQFGGSMDGTTSDSAVFQNMFEYALRFGVPVYIPNREILLTAPVEIGEGQVRVSCHPGAIIRGSGISGNNLFQFTGTSVFWSGGTLGECGVVFMDVSSTNEYIGLNWRFEDVSLFDYGNGFQFDGLIDQNPASSFESIVIRNSKFEARKTYTESGGTAHGAFDVYQERLGKPYRKFVFENNRGLNGGARAISIAGASNTETMFHFSTWRNYVNQVENSADADAQFIFVESGRLIVHGCSGTDLMPISDLVMTNDIEGVRVGPISHLKMTDCHWLNAGGSEAVLNLKQCLEADIDQTTIEWTDSYNSIIQSAAGADFTTAIVPPANRLNVGTLTVKNGAGSVIEFPTNTDGCRVKLRNLIVEDCDTDGIGATSTGLLMIAGGATTPHRVEAHMSVRYTTDPKKVPLNIARVVGNTERLVLTGDYVWDGNFIEVRTTRVDEIRIDADLDWSLAVRGLLASGTNPSIGSTVWRGTNKNHAGKDPVNKIHVAFAQACDRMDIDAQFSVDDFALHNANQFELFLPKDSVMKLHLNGVMERHGTITDGVAIEYDYIIRTDPSGTFMPMHTNETIYQTGTNFAAGGSVIDTDRIYIKLIDLVGSTTDPVSGAIRVKGIWQRTG